MSPITTHVLDLARGRPALGLFVRLEKLHTDKPELLGEGHTDPDGRATAMMPDGAKLTPGPHRLTFDTADYFQSLGIEPFYPTVQITFIVTDPAQHYHVPLLLTTFGYSTYRGS